MFSLDQRLAMSPLLLTLNDTTNDDEKTQLLRRFAKAWEDTEACALDFVTSGQSLALLPQHLRTNKVVDAALDRHIGQVRFLSDEYIENREGFFLRHSPDAFTFTGEESYLQNPDVLYECLYGLLDARKVKACVMQGAKIPLSLIQPLCMEEPPEVDTEQYLWLMQYLHGDYHWREGASFGFSPAQHDGAIMEQWMRGTGAIGSWRTGRIFINLTRMDGGVATRLLRSKMDVTGAGAYFPERASRLFCDMLKPPAKAKDEASWPLVLGFIASSLNHAADFWDVLAAAERGEVACADNAAELLEQLVTSHGGRAMLDKVAICPDDCYAVDMACQLAEIPLEVCERLLDEHPVSNLYCSPLDLPFDELFQDGDALAGTVWDDLLKTVYSDHTPR